MIKASILSIGDEICIGQIVNTNAAWIAAKLTSLGINVKFHSSVMDSADNIKKELTRLMNETEIIIITGGLGPTHDDITKQVLNDFFDDELVFHQPTLDNIMNFLKNRNVGLSERNKEIAFLPSKCKPLPNKLGTAPGMLFEVNDKFIVSLPGVPYEMMQIMNDFVMPSLEQYVLKSDEFVMYKVLHTTGIPESTLADLIGNVDDFLTGNSLAFLPSARGVRLRIGVKGSNFNECRKEIDRIEKTLMDKAGRFIFGQDDESITSLTAKLLKTSVKTVSVAESCTGGLLGGEFTSVSGSSAYFAGGVITYSNESKINILGVDSSIINKHGAVSKETAEQMSQKVRELFRTDYGIGITGIAGPDGGTDDKPVGTVWISLSSSEETSSRKFMFGNDRNTVRERAITAAQNLLYQKLRDMGQ